MGAGLLQSSSIYKNFDVCDFAESPRQHRELGHGLEHQIRSKHEATVRFIKKAEDIAGNPFGKWATERYF